MAKDQEKNPEGVIDSTAAFEEALAEGQQAIYQLRLYVAGSTPQSQRAIANIKQICEEHLAGRFDLEVIDIYQQPKLAEGEQIIAAPTLIKKLPPPLRRFVGDLSNMDRILVGLDLRPKNSPFIAERPEDASRANCPEVVGVGEGAKPRGRGNCGGGAG